MCFRIFSVGVGKRSSDAMSDTTPVQGYNYARDEYGGDAHDYKTKEDCVDGYRRE